jgi:hypothetical protein
MVNLNHHLEIVNEELNPFLGKPGFPTIHIFRRPARKARQEKNGDLQIAYQGTTTFSLPIWRQSFELTEWR